MNYFIRGTGSELTPLQHADSISKQYLLGNKFTQMIGKKGSGKPIVLDSSLFQGKHAGDVGRYHFIPQVFGAGIEGQDVDILGNEDTIEEYYMDIRIDQLAKAFAKKGKMTDKRMIWDYRAEAKDQLANWFKWRTENDLADALTGITTDGVTKLTGSALNSTALVNGDGRCIAPDYANSAFSTQTFNGSQTSNASLLSSLTADDVMNTHILDELQDFAKTAGKYPITPIRMEDGVERYLLILHPKAAIALRRDERWEKRALQSMAQTNSLMSDPIAKGCMGVWENIIIKEADYVRTATNSAGTLTIARNLLLGAEATILAYAQKLEYSEELLDHKRKMSVAADEIRGCRKLTFNGVDMNVAQVPCAI